jgi:hypothetical protein
MRGFLLGMQSSPPEESALRYAANFERAEQLFSFDIATIYQLVRELEMHADINFVIQQIIFLADVGSGPDVPLLVAERQPINRAVGFEVEEKGGCCEFASR